MGRVKSKSGLITNDRERMKCFKIRKAGTMKKAHELSVLCGVPVCVVIFGPESNAKPDVWPRSLEDQCRIIGRYLNTKPDEGRVKAVDRSYGVETKVVEKAENGGFFDQIDKLSFGELMNLVGSLDTKLQDVNARIDVIERGEVLAMIEELQCPEQADLPMPLSCAHPFDDCFGDSEVAELKVMINDNDGFYPINGNAVDYSGSVMMQEARNHSQLPVWEGKFLPSLNYDHLSDDFFGDSEVAELQVMDGFGDDFNFDLDNDEVEVLDCSGAMKMQAEQNQSQLPVWDKLLLEEFVPNLDHSYPIDQYSGECEFAGLNAVNDVGYDFNPIKGNVVDCSGAMKMQEDLNRLQPNVWERLLLGV